MSAGRPTDYTPEMLSKSTEYFDLWTSHVRDNPDAKSLPSIADLSLELGVARSSIYLWGEQHPEFSDILEQILALQERQLTNKGLSGDYNPTITKLMLSKHGYRESSDVTTNGKDMPTPIMDVLPQNNSDQEDNSAQ